MTGGVVSGVSQEAGSESPVVIMCMQWLLLYRGQVLELASSIVDDCYLDISYLMEMLNDSQFG